MELAMELSAQEMHARLQRVLTNVFPDFETLERVERLSGGASQETYRIELTRRGKPAILDMRRASGGVMGGLPRASGVGMGGLPGRRTSACGLWVPLSQL